MQELETIFTDSTFSFGALADIVVPVALASFATVPVISTLWPTCGDSLLSSPSSRYELAVLAEPAVPAVPDADGVDVTLFNTNFALALAPDAAVPLVPVGDALSLLRSRQPVTVTLSSRLARDAG